jgi:hypothetical protein
MKRTTPLLTATAISAALLLGGCTIPSRTTGTTPTERVPAQEGALELEWQPPQNRLNGAPLRPSDIAGYRLYIGEKPGQPERVVDVDDPMQTHQLLRGLKPGEKYYVAITAVDRQGQESPKSKEISLLAEPLTATQIANAERRQDGGQRASTD